VSVQDVGFGAHSTDYRHTDSVIRRSIQMMRKDQGEAGNRSKKTPPALSLEKEQSTKGVDGEGEDDEIEEGMESSFQQTLSISPRDKLSYVEDKKAWKDLDRFHQDNPGVSRLLVLMQMAIMENKPKNVAEFLANGFLSEENQVKLRKELKEVKELYDKR
jgi:hypothetical protein